MGDEEEIDPLFKDAGGKRYDCQWASYELEQNFEEPEDLAKFGLLLQEDGTLVEAETAQEVAA